MTEDNKTPELLEQLEEMAGMGLDISIEDGAFTIRPADAGIALLAAINAHDDEMAETWKAVDDMAKTVEELRSENSLFRQLLLDVVDVMEHSGFEREAAIISRVIWSVKGINEDGEEVEFEWNDDIEPGGHFDWLIKSEEPEEQAQ